jgi:hypothetical protein
MEPRQRTSLPGDVHSEKAPLNRNIFFASGDEFDKPPGKPEKLAEFIQSNPTAK